jgi:hypothetical protein
MSNERKSITIDSASLIGGGGGGGGGGIGGSSKRRSRRSGGGSSDRNERRIRPSSIVQPSTLKKTLLERIKQHQRTRERSRNHDQNAGGGSDGAGAGAGAAEQMSGGGASAKTDENFTQSMDFLRKLALKRREQQQLTQKRRNNNNDIPKNDAKTPEAKMLNDFSTTLKSGEILTNTGLLGLPVVPTHSSAIPTPTPSLGLGMMTPSLNLFDMTSPNQTPEIPSPPKITDLADMYNNTIASGASSAASGTAGTTEAAGAAATAATEPPLHIPEKPEDFLPSIFIKEDPPHGCLKNGTKPTFREWATKMLHKPVDTIKNMFGGGDGDSTQPSQQEQNGGGGGGGEASNGLNGASSGIDPAQVAGMRVKIRKTKKKRFRIGKHDDVVGVLLKNKQTQRHIQTQHLSLKQKTIGEIRKYLYDHHLLKIGSNAPPDVLRRMYEDSILTGDVKNTNKDVLLHNFMSGGGGGE